MNLGIWRPLLLWIAKNKNHRTINALARSCKCLAALVQILRTEIIQMLVVYKNDGYKISYTVANKLHCDGDTPAIITPHRRQWYKHGILHRDGDQPASEIAFKTSWYQRGQLHRDNDQPAVVHITGTQEWYQHGQRHRDNDMPAIDFKDGTLFWLQHGQQHRDNGLAVMYANGQIE